MRLTVYTDYTYHRSGSEIYAERAFALFLAGLREHVEELRLAGRLRPEAAEGRYPVGRGIELVPLPFYPSLARPWRALPALARSLRIFWRSLEATDCVWLLGPHPLAVAFAGLAVARRKRVVLGVRQDMPGYVRSRHPRRPLMWVAAWVLEACFRALGLLLPVVAVGPELARKYRHARRCLELTVSLMRDVDLIAPEEALLRPYDGELRLLAVGRLEEEKNPLLLADVLALLNQADARWRLLVCGEGDLEAALSARLEELGQANRAELRGYVSFGDELKQLYRSSQMLLHTSWTEGLPAVLPEAFAAGLPVVAADVGGIRAAVGDAAILVPPGDPEAAADALRELATDARLRERVVGAGHRYAAAHTLDTETRRLASFLRGS